MAQLQERLQQALAERYTIELELGRGGWAVVYLAWDKKTDRAVAIKALRPELLPTLAHDRFLNEIRLIAQFNHPYILALHDWGEVDGDLLYYVMPVEGDSLRDRLTRQRQLPVADALQIAREIAEALEYAHERGFIHRDIKPENILFKAGHAVVSDFGIARAISVADEKRLSATDVVLGTPEYMSPEQARRGPLDERTDIYSLGVTIYEALTGELPQLDVQATIKTLERLRPDVSPALARAVRRALATEPTDRFTTAAEFARALGAGHDGVRRPLRALLAATAAIAAVALGVKVAVARISNARLDASLHVVVPFGHRGGAAPTLLNGDQCELLLWQAFGRWADVRVVGPLQVHDARVRGGEAPMTLSAARRLARDLGAGTLIWGEVSQFGDSIQVTAAIYGLTRGSPRMRDYTVRIHASGANLEAKFRELADSILIGSVGSGQAISGVVGTDRLGAFYAYAEGREALARWDLPAAERSLRAALATDPEYAHASLWLAQTEMWAGGATADWRGAAARALATRGKLGPGDVALADALVWLADGEFPQACEAYRQLIARDSMDFVAWFGLGECQRRDRIVLPDPTSRSHWRFRSSYRAAAAAYRRALELVPSVHRAFTGIASQRLMDLFFVETRVYRRGRAGEPDTLWFGAFPSLDHDTLAFVPWPMAEVVGGTPEAAKPPTTAAAVEQNRETLREVMATWLRAFPGSADAYEALGLVLETTGELARTSSPERSALAAVRRARDLSHDPDQALWLAATEVRLLVKLEQFEGARALADSLLTAAPSDPEPPDARRLAGLAALTGHVYRTAELLRLTAPVDTPVTWNGREVPDAPVAVKEVALELLAYASLGAPVESLQVLKERVDQRVNSWVGSAAREPLRLAVLHIPVSLAYPALGLTDVHRSEAGGNSLLERQWALAHGDTAWVRAEFARLAALRGMARPGDVSVESYHEALLLLQLGDTAAATRLLDQSLEALPALGTYLLEYVPQTGALMRAMALRAELAARAGERPTAARWARAVVTLWADADLPLQPVVQRMRPLLGPVQRN